ncbi:hypothetical protein R2F61_04665 [Mollicutes bacterium LVI A0078]|nr:hypothetical protein RZE84_04685 [Mollicutes bacterium LVI A0075]WOO91838.1 hypothetical protein R2F61_04665 [Mollicutes bacterium LVI A0078]
MKKILYIPIMATILLTGCSATDNELLSAIEDSYNLKTGTIQSDFKYSTQYDNIEIEGVVEGSINIAYGSDYDKITADINFDDNTDKVEYYVDNKGEILGADDEGEVLYAPLYIDAPDLSKYEDDILEPKSTKIKVDGKDVNVNEYTLELDKLDTEVAKSMFDPIIKLGFVSADIMQADFINGTFNLSYYVNPETGLLEKESLSFTQTGDDTQSTKTTVKIENNYSYDEVEVEVPASLLEEDKTNEESSETK